MALTLEANYSKKVGLPGYSSHQYSLTLKTELGDMAQIQAESARLHKILQNSVDRELQKVGFLPTGLNGNSHSHGKSEACACSDKQQQMIIKIIEAHQLDKMTVDHLAVERFGHGVKQLNKLEASGLIDELLEKYGDRKAGLRLFQKAGGR